MIDRTILMSILRSDILERWEVICRDKAYVLETLWYEGPLADCEMPVKDSQFIKRNCT